MSNRSLVLVAAVLALSCASHRAREPGPATPPPVGSPGQTAPRQGAPKDRPRPQIREGVLVTYKASTRIGEDSFHDDGATLTSDVKLGPRAMTIAITRSPRHVRVTAGGAPKDVEVPADTVVLENGDWQAYAIAAEWFAAAHAPAPVHVMLPAQGITLDGTISVAPTDGGGRRVTVELRGLGVEVEIDADGVVRRAAVPTQALVVQRAGEAPPAEPARAAPAGVAEEAFEVEAHGVAIKGSLWSPRNAKAALPLVVMIAGSGPTDRDGNSGLGLQSDAYRMLAEALAARGIATLRYDKRGVGASGITFDPATLTLGDFVGDARAVIAKARATGRFSSIDVLGHSEGGLIATVLAQDTPIDALILVAAPGRPIAAILKEQLGAQLDPATLREVDRILGAIRDGKSPDPVPEGLRLLFHPNVRRFLQSEMALDPSRLLQKIKIKTAIIQGEHDVQVSKIDARLLAKARPDAKLTLIASMSHVMKDEPSAAQPQRSYADPTMPLAPGLVGAVAAAVGR
jgi:pimeloyl-ACP methyl ester carboxylesterase